MNAQPAPEPLPYRLLTGTDDAEFCRRVSDALADGYTLHGTPALAFNGKHAIVAQAVVLDQERLRAIVVEADAGWAGRAADLTSRLAATLGPAALRIEHIGSTAIPAMAAKDVLDVQVSVADLAAAAESFAQPLAALGFVERPFHHDHVPAGRDDDPQLWSKRFFSRRGHADGDVNLHVRRAGSPNERLALLFRDWFRAHPSAVPAYARFKQMLADAVPDAGIYAEVKDPVVDLVIITAEQWAEATQWQP